MAKADFLEALVTAVAPSLIQPIHDALISFGGQCYDAGAASVPVVVASGPVSFSQEQMDAAVLAKSDADKVALDGLQAELDAAKAQDEADKSALSASQAILDKVRAALG